MIKKKCVLRVDKLLTPITGSLLPSIKSRTVIAVTGLCNVFLGLTGCCYFAHVLSHLPRVGKMH